MPVAVDQIELIVDPPPPSDLSAPQATPQLDAAAAAHLLRQLALAQERAARLQAD